MVASLIIIRYKAVFIPFAVLAMAVFHVPFLLNCNIQFYKLLGTGKNGSFSKVPDLRQWAIFFTAKCKEENKLSPFILYWLRFFGCEVFSLELLPVSTKGSWDGKILFQPHVDEAKEQAPIAILTRATIRPNRLKEFWQHVPSVSEKISASKGLLLSVGIGEIPFIKQATFSIWQNMDDMHEFAYKLKEHAEVIQKTRQRNWYSEEMFTRFKITGCKGTLKGKNPLTHYHLPLQGI